MSIWGGSRRPHVGIGQTSRVTTWGLVSIGYEGRTSTELLDVLVDLRVTTLVDVRLTPLSRKPGLSKIRLGEAARGRGIAYVHLPALGNPRENREPFRTGHTSAGCIRFTQLLARPESVAAMDQLEAFARDGLAAVLCFEREHAQCHRQVIVDQVSERLGARAKLLRV